MSSTWKQYWATVAAALLACVAFAAGAPQAMAVAAPVLAADFDQDGDVDSGDLGVWDAAKYTSSLADADGDGQSDVTDLVIWDDQRGQIAVASTAEAPAVVGVPDVFYNRGTGAVTLVPNATAIYAFKLLVPGGSPATSGLPASWSVRSEFNRLQGYDTTIVTNTPSNLPQFTLGSITGPVTLGVLPTGMTGPIIMGLLYDTTTALNATVPLQVVPEPTSAILLIGTAAALGALSRRRNGRG